MEDLDAASVDDVHAFFRRYYGPNNTVLTIVGDVEPETAFAAVERYFGPLPASAEPPAPAVARPRPRSPSRCGWSGSARCPTTGSTSPGACRSTPPTTSSPASLAIDVLGGLSTSRLVQRLVRDEQSATAVHAHAMGFVDGVSLGLLIIDVAAGVDPAAVESAVVEELDRLIAEGPHGRRAGVVARRDRAVLAELRSPARRSAPTSSATTPCSPTTRTTSTPCSIATGASTREQVQASPRPPTSSRTSRAVVSYLVLRAGGGRREHRHVDDRRPVDSAGRAPPGGRPRRALHLPRPRSAAPSTTASRSSSTTCRASTCTPYACRSPCRCRASRASVEGVATHHGPHPRRGHGAARRRRSSPELLERAGVALGAGASDSGLSVDVDVAKRHLDYALDLLRQALTEPAFPAHRGRPPRQAAPGRDRAGARRSRRSARAIELIATPLRPRRAGQPPDGGQPARRVAAITRDDVVRVPRRARRRRPGRRSSWPATSPASTRSPRSRPRSAAGRRPRAGRPRPSRWPRRRAADRVGIVLVDRPGLGPVRARVACPGPDRQRRGRLGALPGARLRARRLAQRPRRRRAARGEGLHLRHPLGRSARAGAAGSSSPAAACAATRRSRRWTSCSGCSTAPATASPTTRRKQGVDYIAMTAAAPLRHGRRHRRRGRVARLRGADDPVHDRHPARPHPGRPDPARRGLPRVRRRRLDRRRRRRRRGPRRRHPRPRAG